MSRSAPGAEGVEILLAELRKRDVQLRVDGDRLRCNAPPGVLSAEMQILLRKHKGEILELLRPVDAMSRQRAVIPLQPHGTRIPVFGVAGHNGDIFCYQHLAKALGANQPFFGLQPPGLDGRTKPIERVEDVAAYFAEQIRVSYPGGPCQISAYCAGGSIAFELARLLQQEGRNVSLSFFGTPYPTFYKVLAARLWAKRSIMKVRNLVSIAQEKPPAAPLDPLTEMRATLEHVTLRAVRRYRPGRFYGRMTLILPNRQWLNSSFAPQRWRAHCDHVDEYIGADDCDLNHMLLDTHVALIAELFKKSQERETR